jgi:hypothetical protein
MKKMGAALAAMVMLGTLAACGNDVEDVDNGVDTGVVISRARKSVTVMEDDGEKDTHRVSKSVSRQCSVGERWPECKS